MCKPKMDWNPHGCHNVTVAEHIISLLLNQNNNRNISYLNTFSLLSEFTFHVSTASGSPGGDSCDREEREAQRGHQRDREREIVQVIRCD